MAQGDIVITEFGATRSSGSTLSRSRLAGPPLGAIAGVGLAEGGLDPGIGGAL